MWIMRDDNDPPELIGTMGGNVEISDEYTVVVRTEYYGEPYTYFDIGVFTKWKNRPAAHWTNDSDVCKTRVVAWLN